MMKSLSFAFTVLQFSAFRRHFFSYLIYRIAAEMQVVAVIWHLYQLTGSALSLGFVGLARFLPILLVGVPAGLAADTYNRKRLVVLSQTLMIASSLVLLILTVAGLATPHLIYLLIMCSSMATTLDTPARQSLVPHLIPRTFFSRAISLNTILFQSAIVIGPSCAGFLLGWFGIAATYAGILSCFLIGTVFLLLVPFSPRRHQSPSGFSVGSVLEGFRFVIHTPIIFTGSLLDFFATFFSSATVLLPIFAVEILHAGPTHLGFLYAAAALGSVAAGLFLSGMQQISNRGKLLIVAVLVYGAATIGFGFSRTFMFAFLFLFLTGSADSISTILRNTIRQEVTPDQLRGRMVAVNMLFFMGGPQLGELEAGVLAAALGAPLSVIIGGAGTIIATLIIAWRMPALRKYK